MDNKLIDGYLNGFIDHDRSANLDLIPSLITNDYEEGEKVLTEIIKELKKCVEFKLCVAFLTSSGVLVLKNTLEELKEKNIKGTIIVSQYQNFTEPKALRDVMKYSNIELKIVPEDQYMHSKGYIFKYADDVYSIIVGSSNLTQNALCMNKEWNVKINSLDNGSYTRLVLSRFDEMEKNAEIVTEEWIDNYEKKYKTFNRKNIVEEEYNTLKIKPNYMQKEALKMLNKIRKNGENKALAISSTGTGKTILCALDVKQVQPKKVLFVIHRENICNAALKTFKRVLGSDIKTCILGGESSNYDPEANYVFAMIQTLSKDKYLDMFDKDEFDYIIFDEAHHLGAKSTKKVFDYFKPEFMLGMTATPERTDRIDIYSMFNYNIACEIRLNDAMKANLVCPFHYFGVTDLTVNGETIEDDEDFLKLTSDERVKHIINKIEYYGYSGEKVKGLVFTSKIEEAQFLSNEFNKRGYKTVALTGKDTERSREHAVDLLESDDENEYLDYIFTVDIFNEGIDIQKINQIVMLRPTESAIIFVQQLGRGLRKNEDKEYVVVIDFIGNYKNSFLVPIALSGDRTYNKDKIRHFIKECNKTIPGASTIEFEPIVEKRIFEKLDKAKLGDAGLIKQGYKELKNKLGRIPEIDDFDRYGSIDVTKIFACKAFRTYYTFLKKVEKEKYKINFSDEQVKYLEIISTKYGFSKKALEVEFIKLLINNPSLKKDELIKLFKKNMIIEYSLSEIDDLMMDNIINQMTGDYFESVEKKSFGNSFFMKDGLIDSTFKKCIEDDEFKDEVLKLIDYIIKIHKREYIDYYKNTLLCLNKKYTYEDVLRVIGFKKNLNGGAIGGYKYDSVTNTIPIFVNYDKDEGINESIKYQDRFVSRDSMTWYSKNGRKIESKEIQHFINSDKDGIKIFLFVRKNKDDDESKEFYFLGQAHVFGDPKQVKMQSGHDVVEMTLKLDDPVREDLYDYIIND